MSQTSDFSSKIFAKAASPDEAEGEFQRFRESYQQKTSKSFEVTHASQPLLPIFGNSRFLARTLTQWPHHADTALKSTFLATKKDYSSFETELQSLSNPEDRETLLAYKYQELLRITMKDLKGGQDQDVLYELSALAYALLRHVDKLSYQESVNKWGAPILNNGAPCSYSILAMGKLGGWELNYSSDIDLLALTESDEGSAKHLSLHEFFVRHIQQITTYLTKQDSNGFFYRVDWDLRPEGKAGTLINSMAALEAYYESFGADWERQALTKATWAAGSQTLCSDFLSMITPFIYRQSHDVDSMERISIMKQKIHDQLPSKSRQGFNVKLGTGGIREIEFFIQAFLMVYGGRKKELRDTGTLQVLSTLEKLRLVDSKDAKDLKDCYLYLRRLENRLQMEDEKQTHQIPDNLDEQYRIARRMGYLEDSRDETLKIFQEDLQSVTSRVHHLFDTFFTGNNKSSVSIPSSPIVTVESGELTNRLSAAIDGSPDFEDKLNAIRIFKIEEFKKIQQLESDFAQSRQEILSRLSLLAEVICQETLKLATNELLPRYGTPMSEQLSSGPSHLLALGMGKLGGSEINYHSDLDMIFVFSEAGTTTGPKCIDNSEYFARLVQKFISILSVPTQYGAAYSIDTELRPSGNQGPLVTSLASFMDYQMTGSALWERQALLKARPLAGSSRLASLVTNHLNALLYSSPFERDIKKEMAKLRLRVQKEIARERNRTIDYKLGKGGLMDVEFIVQYIQLVHGSDYPAIRTTNTFDAIDRIAHQGLLPEPMDGLILKEIYTFYRTLESKISLKLKDRIHRIKDDHPVWAEVALDLNMPSAKALIEQYRQYRENCRRIYRRVFGLKVRTPS